MKANEFFIFSERNIELRNMYEQWLDGSAKGVFLLEGDSGSGKSTFLKHLRNSLPDKYREGAIFPGESFMDHLVCGIKNNCPIIIPDSDVIMIDDGPGINIGNSLMNAFISTLSGWTDRTVIITQSDGRVRFLDAFETYKVKVVPVYPLEVTLDTVKTKAHILGYDDLSTEMLQGFVDNCDSIQEVVTAMNDVVGLGKVFSEFDNWF